MLRSTILGLCLSVLTLSLWGQEFTIVTVKAPGAQERLACLSIVPNAFTAEEVCVDSCWIDSTGAFRLQMQWHETVKAYIDIDYYRAYIYLEPGVNYDLEFEPFDYHQDEQLTPLQMDFYLAYRMTPIDTNALNYLIWSLDAEVDRFVAQNVQAIEREGRRDLLDTFHMAMQKRFGFSGHAYFVDYLRYTLADLHLIFGSRSRQALYEDYLHERPIPVANVAYAAFMKDYWDAYFPTSVPYSYFVFLDQLHDPQTGLEALIDSLGRSPIFQNERFREAVLLTGMSDLAHDSDVHPMAVPRFLRYYASQTKFPELAYWALSLETQIRSQLPGASKDPVELLDKHGHRFSIPDTSQTYTYLLFVRDRCQECPNEIKTLDEIELPFDQVRYVLVNCDYMYEKYLILVSGFNYKRVGASADFVIPYLHFDKQIKWQKSMGAYSYPHAVLLDAKGRVISPNYKKPSQGLSGSIREFLKKN